MLLLSCIAGMVSGYLLLKVRDHWTGAGSPQKCVPRLEPNPSGIQKVTSCARREYDFSQRLCRHESVLEYFGQDVRTYYEQWEWDRVYTVHWSEAEGKYPSQFEWNITMERVAYIELLRNETSMDFTFHDLATAFADGRDDGRSNAESIKDRATGHAFDSRLMVKQEGNPDETFFGPRFTIVDRRSEALASLDKDDANRKALGSSEDWGKQPWNSKFVVEFHRMKPEGVETEVLTGTVGLFPTERPKA